MLWGEEVELEVGSQLEEGSGANLEQEWKALGFRARTCMANGLSDALMFLKAQDRSRLRDEGSKDGFLGKSISQQ